MFLAFCIQLFVVNSVGFLLREEQVSLQVQVEKVRFFVKRFGSFFCVIINVTLTILVISFKRRLLQNI